MNFKVPAKKLDGYSTEVFNMISTHLYELANEYGKWPDQMLFSGPLGKELYDLIIEKGWDLHKFGPRYTEGPKNTLIFKYSKRIDKVEERGGVTSSLDGFQANTLLSPEDMQKILLNRTQFSYVLEKSLEPKLIIHLTRN